MREKFRGVGVALITPFKEDLTVDYDALLKVINHTVNGNIDYLVVNGTTGEASTLERVEKDEILKFVGNNNPKQLPLMYGIGANSTKHVLDAIKKTDFTNIDAILTVSPYYNKPTQEGIYQHYKAVAEASPVPVFLYNVPGRTAVNIEASTTLRLAELPNIVGIKEASGDLIQCMEIAKNKSKDFMLLSGVDTLTLAMISMGAEGVISVLANVFPESFCKSIHMGLEGDFQGAREILFSEFLSIDDLMYKESNPVGAKLALSMLGVCEKHVRPPLAPASSMLEAEMEIEMKKMTSVNR